MDLSKFTTQLTMNNKELIITNTNIDFILRSKTDFLKITKTYMTSDEDFRNRRHVFKEIIINKNNISTISKVKRYF